MVDHMLHDTLKDHRFVRLGLFPLLFEQFAFCYIPGNTLNRIRYTILVEKHAFGFNPDETTIFFLTSMLNWRFPMTMLFQFLKRLCDGLQLRIIEQHGEIQSR